MARASGVFVHDGIGPTLDYMVASTAGRVMEAMIEGEAKLQMYAQLNAPWSDITGAARSGLTSSLYMEDGYITVEIAHTVEHGYWLEMIQDGRFAILLPTIEALGPEIIRDAGAQVVSLRGF